MNEKKSFLGLGIIYTAGQIMLQVVSFFLLPIYTSYLTTTEYGQYALTNTVSDFISFLIILGIYTGYNRFYKECDSKSKIVLRNTAFSFAILSGLFFLFITLLFGRQVAGIVFDMDNSYSILIYIVLNNIFLQTGTIFICDYYLEYKAAKAVAVNLTRGLLNVALVIVFIVLGKQGVIGIFKAQTLCNFIIFGYFVIINIKTLKFSLNKSMLWNMFKFSTGLIPCNMASTVLTLSDRFFLKAYRSYSETGVYSVGYRFGTLIEPLFVVPFKQIFTTYKYEIWKSKEAQKKLNEMFIKYHVIGCFVLLGIAVYSRFVIYLFTPQEYLYVYKIVPVILVSYFIYGKSRFYNLGIEMKNKTYLDSLILFAGAVVNIIFNILLIPQYGMTGASVATMISYLFINFMYLRISRSLYHVVYDVKRAITIQVITLFLYVIYFFTSVINSVVFIDLLIGLFLLSFYIFLCLLFGIIKASDLIAIKVFFLNKMNRGVNKTENQNSEQKQEGNQKRE